MQATGEFDEMVVWSHESMATAAADPYVRNIEEWLQTSEKVRIATQKYFGDTIILLLTGHTDSQLRWRKYGTNEMKRRH